ncbi:MAG: hypothetical protein ABR500_12810 [Dermatophilaceae bacterium]|nr:hypothetical protein [Intrasporangiaceae bacterium]
MLLDDCLSQRLVLLLEEADAALPSLILFRQGNLEQVADDRDAGAIIVFTNDNIRIRKLPIQN